MRSITVIIPTNRLGRWLDEAVASVLASVGVTVEVIVVFDGPIEGELPAWANDERTVILRHTENRGPSTAMMGGLRIASHDLIARLDSDDLCRPNRLANQAAYLDAHPDTIAVGARTARIGPEGEALGAVKLPFGSDIRPRLLLSNVLPHSTLMFRREASERVGGYDVGLRQMEDYDFILRLGSLGPLAQLEETLVDYRVHASQASRGAKPFGRHITVVLRGRRRLSRVLKPASAGSGPGSVLSSVLSGEAKNLVWVAAQYARYYGVIRPAHEH